MLDLYYLSSEKINDVSSFRGVAQSQSVSFAAGSTGITGSLSQAVSHLPNQGFDFGNAAASSSSSVQNGHASSAASSSVNSAKPSLSTSVGISHSQGTSIRFPEQSHHRQPIWTNIDPNHNTGNVNSKLICFIKLHEISIIKFLLRFLLIEMTLESE